MPFSAAQKEFITRKHYGLHWLSGGNGIRAAELFKQICDVTVSKSTIYNYWSESELRPGGHGGHRHGVTDGDLAVLYEKCSGDFSKIISVLGYKDAKSLRKRFRKIGLISPAKPFTAEHRAYITNILHEKSDANGVIAAKLFKDHFKRDISPGTVYRYWKNAGLRPGRADYFDHIITYDELFITSIKKISSL